MYIYSSSFCLNSYQLDLLGTNNPMEIELITPEQKRALMMKVREGSMRAKKSTKGKISFFEFNFNYFEIESGNAGRYNYNPHFINMKPR